MNKVILNLAVFLFLIKPGFSQSPPTCPSNSIYTHVGNNINSHAVPNGPGANVLANMPVGSGGLCTGPSFNFPAPNPTWWTTAGNPKTYWYYNNTGGWTNTGHAVTNMAAVNLGGGGGKLYNLVGFTGQIYVYDGTGPDQLLTTLTPPFSGGGPFDVVCDLADNFFILKTATPGQGLYVYNPQGALTCSFAAIGMMSQTAGGGFAILPNPANPSTHRIYYKSNGVDYIGDFIPGNTSINFTTQPLPPAGDYASCALTLPQGSITAPQGGTLTCTNPQVTLVASILGNASFNWNGGYNTPTTTPVPSPTCGTILWNGPGPNNTSGIVSGQGTPTVVVNQPGVYTFTWTGCNGCPGYSVTASYTVVGQGATIFPIITAPTCISSATQISVSPNSPTNTILWTGPGILGPNNTPTITINSAGIYSVSISVPNSACAGSASVQIHQTPTITISASSNSMCLYNYNNSPNSVTLTASGATSYTWMNISGLINTSGSSTNSTISFTPDVNASVGTIELIGSNGTCSNTATYSILIVPNPVVSVNSASICQGNTVALIASGANSYAWSPPTSLSSTSGATVIANPTGNMVYSIIGTSLGCNSTTQQATVNVVPNPTIQVGPTTNTICQGGQLQIVASGATNYSWIPSSYLSNTTGPVVVASPPVTTNYTVIGEAATCTAMAVYQVSVIVMPAILVTTSADTICQNSSVILTANGASSYTWSPNIGLNTVFGPQVIASPPSSMVYTVSGSNGVCTAYGTVAIVVVPFPNMNVSTPSSKICQNSSTSIFADGAQYYIWSPSAGLSSTASPVAQASPLTSTNYTIRGYNKLGSVVCNMAREIFIEVVPTITASISNSAAICVGQSVKLLAEGSNTYSWIPSDGLNYTNIPGPVASPTVSTLYTVYVSTDGNCAVSKTVYIKVNSNPTVSAGEDFVANMDEPMHLNAVGNGTLTWVYGDGIMCESCPNTQIMPKRSGCYRVQAVNEFGCKSSDEVCVEVTSHYNIYIPNIFTPNGDGLNDVFLVYGTGLSNFEMIIYDRWGEKLFQSKDQLQGWDGTYKGELSKDDVYTYLVKYQSLDGKKHTKTGHVTLMK